MSAAANDNREVSVAGELSEAFSKLMKGRIRLAPVHTLRASSVGHDCERYLFYEQTAHEKRVAHGEELQAIFELGKQLEDYALRLLEDMGFRVEQRNRDYHDRAHALTGHIDGRLMRDGWAKSIPIEVKGLNPYTAESLKTWRDVKESRQWWVRKYYAQLQTYLHQGDDELGVFVLLNKLTGRLEFIDVPRDRDYAAQLLAKADRIKEAVLANVAPERHRSQECARCPFVHVCLPDIDFGPGAQVLDVPELIAALERREKYREGHKEYEAASKIIKELMPKEAGALLVGPFAAEGKKVERKGFEVKPSAYVTWDFKRIAGAEGDVTPPAPLNPFPPNATPKESK